MRLPSSNSTHQTKAASKGSVGVGIGIDIRGSKAVRMLCGLCNAVKSASVSAGRRVVSKISSPHPPPPHSSQSPSASFFSTLSSFSSPRTARTGTGTGNGQVSVSVVVAMASATKIGLLPAVISGPAGATSASSSSSSSSSGMARWISTCPSLNKSEDWKAMLRSLPRRDLGTEGERDFDFDPTQSRVADVEFPDDETPNRLYDGVPYSQIPLMCVRATKNNTIIILADTQHKVICRRSCGTEGFKNCRKGTNVAAQTTAISIAKTAQQEYGVKQVRVKVRGFGPGRMASLKGFQLAGLEVVSISDITYINWRNVPRPKKQKRL